MTFKEFFSGPIKYFWISIAVLMVIALVALAWGL